MIKKLMAIASLAVVAGAGSFIAPTTATAKGPPAADYAVAQCGNGGWAQKQYPTYEDCYAFAVQYYYAQGGGGGGGSGGGGGGGSALPGLPTWSGCEGTRLPCNIAN